jgi:sugar fermentation stimulation protein A
MSSDHPDRLNQAHVPVQVPLTASGPLVEAQFRARPNQFLVEARLSDRIVKAHLADRGRLLNLLTPGARLLLAPRDEIGRRTSFQVVGVYHGDELVSLDTHLPNRLVSAALQAGALPQFEHPGRVQAEVSFGAHRFDFRVGDGPTSCLIEVKSVTRLVAGIASFPDAPSERARRQVELLGRVARNGQRAALLFVVQRHQADAFVPADDIDPAFARVLRSAVAAGVEIYAYLCPLTPDGIRLGDPLPFFGSIDAVPPGVRTKPRQ